MIKVTRNPTPKQISKFGKFSKDNWGQQSAEGDSEFDFYDTSRIIFENYQHKKLVSGLLIFLKSIVFSDRILHIAGIGGVVTHKKYRHKGYALETLNYTIKELKKMKLDAVLLCTEIDKLGSLYEKAGFKPLNKPYFFINKHGIEKKEMGGMIANVGNNNAFNFMIRTSEKIFVGLSNF